MGTFLSYEPLTGALVGGFNPMSTRVRGGAWVPIPLHKPGPTARAVTPCWTSPGQLAWIEESGASTVRICQTDGQSWEKGSNWLYGGGGRWIGCHAVKTGPFLYLGPTKTIKGGKHGVGADGSWGYNTDYHGGFGVVMFGPDDVELPGSRRTDVPCQHMHVVDKDGAVAYYGDGRPYCWVWNGKVWARKRMAYPAYHGEMVRWKGELYLVYTGAPRWPEGEEGIYIHHVDEPRFGWKKGKYVSGQNGTYNGVAWADPATNKLWVAWSTTQGASLKSIREEEVVGDPVRLPDTEPVPVPETALKLGRPIFLGAYDTMKPLETTARLIGNVGFPYKERVRDCPLPLILASDTLPYDNEGDKWSDYAGIMNRTLYYYVHCNGSSFDQGKAQWDRLKTEPEKPTIFYLDGRTVPDLPSWFPKGLGLIALQCYPGQTESAEEFEAAMERLVTSAERHGLPIVMTPAFYDRGWFSEAQMRSWMPVYEKLLLKYRWVGIMPFSDLRANGMVKYPWMYDWLKRWLEAIPARPNRYQWWTPSDDAEEKRALKDLVSYDLAGFSPAQRATLHALIDGM